MNDFQDLGAESNLGPSLEEGLAWQGGWQSDGDPGCGAGLRTEGARDRKGEGLLEAVEGHVSRDTADDCVCPQVKGWRYGH